MELKRAEEEVNELRELYLQLCRVNDDLSLPDFHITSESNDGRPADSENPSDSTQRDAIYALSALERMQKKLSEMEPNMAKFQAKCESSMKSDQPRYGPATQARVKTLIKHYNDLKRCIDRIFDEETEESERKMPIIHLVRLQAEQQERLAIEKLREAEELLRLELEAKQAEEDRRKEEEQKKQLEMQAFAERQRQEKARQFEEARQVERQARLAAEQADREWLASIPRGPDGVRDQLGVLLKSTEDDPVAQKIAIRSLHTIYTQITTRPEDFSFRRIRRDHVKFNDDIGRHPGGKEILIASGFEVGTVDAVPCFLMKEPNIEQDMDGWSHWFDTLKTTLEILELEMKD